MERIAARKLSGMERHRALVRANDWKQRERLLAYGYLRHRTYSQIENKCREAPGASIIAHIAGVNGEDISNWLKQRTIALPRPEPVAEAEREVA